jgi:hypothetical protein
LDFQDIDWDNIQEGDFQSINFTSQDDQLPTMEEIIMMEQFMIDQYR